MGIHRVKGCQTVKLAHIPQIKKDTFCDDWEKKK